MIKSDGPECGIKPWRTSNEAKQNLSVKIDYYGYFACTMAMQLTLANWTNQIIGLFVEPREAFVFLKLLFYGSQIHLLVLHCTINSAKKGIQHRP